MKKILALAFALTLALAAVPVDAARDEGVCDTRHRGYCDNFDSGPHPCQPRGSKPIPPPCE